MTPEQWRDYLVEKIELAESESRTESSVCFVVIGKSMRGIGVRPEIVAWHEDGSKAYMFTVAVARRALKKVENALADAADS